MNKVVLLGGNSKIPGFGSRLLNKFESLWKTNQNTNNESKSSSMKSNEIAKLFKPKTDPQLITFQGLWMMSQVIQPEQFITNKEYKEIGVEVLKRKNLSKNLFLQ